MRGYKLTGFSDEIAPFLDEQLDCLNRFGVEYMEIRGVDGKNVSELTPDEARAVRKKLDAAGVKVSAIGSPIGKVEIEKDFAPHFALFCKVVETAKILGTRYIRMFSFFTGENPQAHREEVLLRLKKMIEYAKEQDVVLLHENEKDIYGDTAPRCLDLMENLCCDNFWAVFDFANFVQCGQDTREAFGCLKQYVKYIHIKDAVGAQVVPAGMGEGRLREILRELLDSGYEGFLSLEPHLSDFSGFAALENGREKSEKISDGAFSWQIALASLKGILYDLEG